MCSHSALNLFGALQLSSDISEGTQASRPPTGLCSILAWDLGFGEREPPGEAGRDPARRAAPWMPTQDGPSWDGGWAGRTRPHCAGRIPPRQVGRATGWDIQQVFTVAETAEF